VLALQYLCCELAHLQEARHMRALRVYDVAHLAWRMRLTTELEGHITEYKTVGGCGRDVLDCSSPEQS